MRAISIVTIADKAKNQTLSYVSVAPKIVKHLSYDPPRRPSRPQNPNRNRTIAHAITITLMLLMVFLYTSTPTPALGSDYTNRALQHPELQFTAIVNPSTGPGAPPYPGSLYIEAVTRLNTIANVQTIGYIDTAGGSKSGKSIISEIATYSGWFANPTLALHGIFFDRTPYENTNQANELLRNISAAVKHADGFRFPRLVVQNPGRVPDPELVNSYVDLTIVYEGPYAKVPSRDVLREKLKGLPDRRENYGVLVHSMREGLGNVQIRKTINGLKQVVGGVYLSDFKGKGAYMSFQKRSLGIRSRQFWNA
ncbi:hypothetical protein M011DRAFT_456036 [Sporormia fimetaria CBS 119925]|uniref:Uncharacterized protein n=1 Tax=Sporormia fimetaria CBS 119925 TaxID=1340428 RepID=A0A6A6VIV6_9PLEO|nr:hypothetical protein M011DRAFT_456036 [Sporormia fimetaria CBS 119925]